NDQPPKTQREIAVCCGISRSYVSRIEKKALDKLKNGFEAEKLPSHNSRGKKQE
ncbi:MAG: sigma factor-like helix-turn-helix DNA-binding protein, partial [Oscillospiraceae bacterium]|nr:sigma factor-like helix-turn-helix DNA-binding protein [Oscillospiraceae bacterium]